jgi:hypothetical protein
MTRWHSNVSISFPVSFAGDPDTWRNSSEIFQRGGKIARGDRDIEMPLITSNEFEIAIIHRCAIKSTRGIA